MAAVESEYFFTAADGIDGHSWKSVSHLRVVPPLDAMNLITFCVLVLRNGHRVVGVNEGPVSTDNFDPELGRYYARKAALDQLWPLLGYALRDRLSS